MSIQSAFAAATEEGYEHQKRDKLHLRKTVILDATVLSVVSAQTLREAFIFPSSCSLSTRHCSYSAMACGNVGFKSFLAQQCREYMVIKFSTGL